MGWNSDLVAYLSLVSGVRMMTAISHVHAGWIHHQIFLNTEAEGEQVYICCVATSYYGYLN